MSYSRFDRHAEMSSETLSAITKVLRNHHFDGRFNELTNMIWGLFDGYFYEQMLPLAKEQLSNELYNDLKNIVNTVKKYQLKLV